jgi:3'-5' exoribonuclease
MGTTRINEPIANWQDGDAVQGFALLSRRELRQDKNGREYLDLELRDAGSAIPAKVWSDNQGAMETTPEVHRFVKLKGTVRLFRSHNQLQLTIERCREAHDGDRQAGFDEAALIPTTREDIDELWRRLHRIFRERIARPVLRRLAEETLAAHAELREHPAAKAIHHAYRGGLLEHVTSMAVMADRVCDHYPELDRDLVLTGVLFHDLGKLVELGAMPANDYTLPGRLVGHVVIGRDLLRARCAAIENFPADLQLHLEHLVLSHQGLKDYGSPVEPMTPEAIALHFLDDLDSKLNQLRAARENGPLVQYSRGMGRHMYLGLPLPEAVEIAASAEAEETDAPEPEEAVTPEAPEAPEAPEDAAVPVQLHIG